MQVIVVFNPNSGSGRASQLAGRFVQALKQRGIVAQSVQSKPALPGSADPSESMQAQIGRIIAANQRAEPCLLVAVGGDGTVRSCIPAALAHNCILFHLASGNENLFSRQFNWPRDPVAAASLIANAIDNHTRIGTPLASEINTMDIVAVGPSGQKRSESAAIMVSAGFDADVVAQLDAQPRGVPGHMAYLAPIVRTLTSWRPPRLSLSVDGKTVITDQPGWLIVANMPQYALRLNPCQVATPSDGLLDVLFVPMTWIGDCLASLVELARGSIGLMPGARHFQARAVEVRCRSLAVQADGDHIFRSGFGQAAGGEHAAGDELTNRLLISVHSHPLRIFASNSTPTQIAPIPMLLQAP